ncbi:MAG: hypothetical protein K6G40_05780, partial [Eubacterium sp.]|nr:hypothetical protein [Eubacterium sp.]
MNKYLRRWLNIILEIVAGIIFAATLFVVIYAALSPAPAGEANIGNLKTRDFNDGWTMSLDGEEQSIILPATIKDVKGKTLVIKNILPDDVSDGMTLCTRASLEDIYIYIGGELRECYTSESFPLRMYYNPSSYIFTDLSNEDAGKEIRIELFVKAAGDINPVNLGYGATAWIDIIKNSVLVAAMGFLLIIFGVIAVIMYIVF